MLSLSPMPLPRASPSSNLRRAPSWSPCRSRTVPSQHVRLRGQPVLSGLVEERQRPLQTPGRRLEVALERIATRPRPACAKDSAYASPPILPGGLQIAPRRNARPPRCRPGRRPSPRWLREFGAATTAGDHLSSAVSSPVQRRPSIWRLRVHQNIQSAKPSQAAIAISSAEIAHERAARRFPFSSSSLSSHPTCAPALRFGRASSARPRKKAACSLRTSSAPPPSSRSSSSVLPDGL